MSIRLSASPSQRVTVTLEVPEAATVSPAELVFDGDDWSSWQVAQVSLSSGNAGAQRRTLIVCGDSKRARGVKRG